MTTATDGNDAAQHGNGPRRLLSALRGDRATKGLGLATMLVGFFMALEQVDGLVAERAWMRGVARDAVGALWGPEQRITGPFLIVPVDRVTGSGTGLRAETAQQVIAPGELAVTVALDSETRRRGLFDVPVYTATATLTGRFDPADLTALSGAGLQRPALALQTAGAASIVGMPEASWNDADLTVDPDLPDAVKAVLGTQAVAATLPADALADLAEGRFSMTVALRGTERLMLAPAGRSSTIDMRSSWPHPSFVGSRTAETHDIRADGFTARWHIGPFGRAAPASWAAGSGAGGTAPLDVLEDEAFGVDLVQPVDPYRMTGRTLKYGMLFALYTFGAFVLMETVFRRPLHWLHYLLTGASVASFFLLLLSLSELVGFATAYALGAAGVVGQSGLYARAVLGDRRLAAGFAGLLALLYAGLYGLLRLEDTALVTGSVGLFAAIGIAMVLTRQLNAVPRGNQ